MKLAAANGIVIPYIRHLFCDIKICGQSIEKHVVYIIKDKEIHSENDFPEIICANVLACFQIFMSVYIYKNPQELPQPINNVKVWVGGGKKTHIPALSVCMVQVRGRIHSPLGTNVLCEPS